MSAGARSGPAVGGYLCPIRARARGGVGVGVAGTRAWPGRPDCAYVVPQTARRLQESALIRDQSSRQRGRVRPAAAPAAARTPPGPTRQPPPAGRHAPATELAHRQQRPRGGGTRHEHDRGHAGPVRHGAGASRAPEVDGRTGWTRCHSAAGRRLSARVVMGGIVTSHHSFVPDVR